MDPFVKAFRGQGVGPVVKSLGPIQVTLDSLGAEGQCFLIFGEHQVGAERFLVNVDFVCAYKEKQTGQQRAGGGISAAVRAAASFTDQE